MIADNEFVSEHEIVRIAERERAEVIAAYFRNLFARREKGKSALPGNAVPAE